MCMDALLSINHVRLMKDKENRGIIRGLTGQKNASAADIKKENTLQFLEKNHISPSIVWPTYWKCAIISSIYLCYLLATSEPREAKIM